MSNHEDLVATMLAALKAAAVVIPIGTGVLNEVDEAIEAAERHLAMTRTTAPAGAEPDIYEALKEAAESLNTIATQAGKEYYLADGYQIRGYANSRANVARAALAKADACR